MPAPTICEGPLRERILVLEETMRKTSICGLGQVALGPVVSVLGLEKGRAAARPQPRPGGASGQPGSVTGREFFTAKTVAEALSGFRPTRRTAVEVVEPGGRVAPGPRRRHLHRRGPPGLPPLHRRRLRGGGF